MLALASDSLGAMPPAQIPGLLRKSASFTPARRRKLIGSQLGDAIEADDEFRDRLAVHVRAIVPEIAARLDRASESTPPSDDDAAAVSYLLRQPGWEAVIQAAADATPVVADVDSAALDRASASLADARAELKQAKEKHRAQLDAVKAENAQIRRNLGQSRIEVREAIERAAEVAAHCPTSSARRGRASARMPPRRADFASGSPSSSPNTPPRGARRAMIVTLR